MSTDGLSARYCELNRLGEWLRQPSNALSSASYIAIAATLPRRGRVPMALRVAFALSLVALGLGSGWFHASIILVAQNVDMTATYGLVLALILIGLRLPAPVALGVLLVADLAAYVGHAYRFGTWLLPLLICIAAVVAITARGSRRTLVLAFAGMITGGAAWILDDHKVLCAPQSPLQWHALWHVTTALGAGMLFRYYDGGEA